MNDKEDLEALCANLADLYNLGSDTIPSIADQFTHGATALGSGIKSASGLGDYKYFNDHTSHEPADGFFEVDDKGDGPSMAEATLKSATSWSNVVEEFATILSNTDANLRLAAGALLLAVREYAEDDEVHDMLLKGTGEVPFMNDEDLKALDKTDDSGKTEKPEDMDGLTGEKR